MSLWRLEMLGRLRACRGRNVLERFPSRATGLLLVRLALPPRRRHAREALIECLWPGVEPDAGRNRLRQALSTLRRLLEPPELPAGCVFEADRQSIGLAPDAVGSDLEDFEDLLRQGRHDEALHRYGGEFLPGYFDDWVEDERQRLEALCERARQDGQNSPRARGAPSQTVAPRPAPAAPLTLRKLPAYPSTFFGRERESAAVLEALGRARLVTLTGLGGLGKTRLAVESARLATGFARVVFVPLAQCQEANAIYPAISDALGMDAASGEARAQLLAFLAGPPLLLVLDNFEQLADCGAPVVLDLLEQLPHLSCLVTSRRALALSGELALAVDPLPLPDGSMDLAVASLTPSLGLFVDRARGARADFALCEANRADLIALCRALEGLPLAIEIAASRIRSYSPAELRAALAARFELLRRPGGRGAATRRHASLLATIEWSWQLLAAETQASFAALSVLRGTWSMSTAAALLARSAVADDLETLVADSLLCVEPGDEQSTRFHFLETLREFAHLRLAPEARASWRQRHRQLFLERAAVARAAGQLPDERDWPNYREALATALQDRQAQAAIELALALEDRWLARGISPEEWRLIDAALTECDPAFSGLAAVLDLLARLALNLGQLAVAERYAQRALAHAEHPARRASALITGARALWEREPQNTQVVAAIDEALALALESGEVLLEAEALRVRATMVLKHGSETADYTAADALFAAAEARYASAGKDDWVERIGLSRAACLTGLGRYAEARRLLDQAEAHFSQRDSVADLGQLANLRGYLESGQGRWAQALAAGQQCVRLAWEHHAHLLLTLALWNLPYALVMLGRHDEALRLQAFAVDLWQRVIGPLTEPDQQTVAEVQALAAVAVPPEEADALAAQGARLSLEGAVQLALGVR